MAPAETPDIFISYAHADNGVALGASSPVGWVSALAANLNEGPNVLKKHIFIDHQLKPGDQFNDELLARVGNSRLLVLLLSQNYVESRWCGDEVEHFVRSHGGDLEKPADVFVVELFPFEKIAAVPAIIQALRKRLIHAKFWCQPIASASPVLAGYPSPKDSGHEVHYWSVLNQLRDAIDTRLRSLRATAPADAPADAAASKAGVPAAEPGAATADARRQNTATALGTVLLADSTDDLELQRNAVKLALEPEGVVVLPEGDYVGLTSEEFDAAIAADLARSDLFVQLLSPTAGRKSRGFAAPLPQLQFQRAREAGRPIMQWCEQLPGEGQIVDPAHASLFATESLRVTHRAAFSSEVIERLRTEKANRERAAAAAAPATPTASRAHRPLIFVDDLASMPALTGRLSAIIREQNFDLRGLPPNAPLGNNGIDVRELLRPCRAGITIYADPSKYLAVYNRLLYFLNQLAENGLAIERWGVYLEHGTVASEFRIESDDVVAVNEQCLGDFLRGL